MIGAYIASQVQILYPRWDFDLNLKLVDNAIGNIQLGGSNGSKYCLDFGYEKRLYIYRDNRYCGDNVRMAMLFNEEFWPEVPIRDRNFQSKARIGTVWPNFDNNKKLTALFPSAGLIDRRKSLITMIENILEISCIDISTACAKVDLINHEIDKKLYAAEGNLRSVLVRPGKWAISYDISATLKQS